MACSLIITRDLECTIHKHNTSVMRPPVGNGKLPEFQTSVPVLWLTQENRQKSKKQGWERGSEILTDALLCGCAGAEPQTFIGQPGSVGGAFVLCLWGCLLL